MEFGITFFIGRFDNNIMLRIGDAEYMEKYGYEGMHLVNFHDGSEEDAMASFTGAFEELGIEI